MRIAASAEPVNQSTTHDAMPARCLRSVDRFDIAAGLIRYWWIVALVWIAATIWLGAVMGS